MEMLHYKKEVTSPLFYKWRVVGSHSIGNLSEECKNWASVKNEKKRDDRSQETEG